MQHKFPLTINNAGETLTFKGITIINGIETLEGYAEVLPNAGPPMHTHFRQDEGFEILSGTMAYQILGQEVKYAHPGETIWIKAGQPHKFWNAGTDILKCKGYITPPENFVYFLSEMYKSISKTKTGKPGLYDSAFLLNRYKSEYDMLEIPPFVQKVIFPIVLFLGKIAGKHKAFANAPAPVMN